MSVFWDAYLTEMLVEYYERPTPAAHRRWGAAFLQCVKAVGTEAACEAARRAYAAASTASSAEPGGATARASEVDENSVPVSPPR